MSLDSKQDKQRADQNCDNHQPWTPPRGPITRAVTWLILIFIAIILLGMLAAVFGT